MSLNTVAYQVLTNIKPSTGLAYLGNMQYAGIYPEDNNAVASIGGFTEGVSPVEQAGGYHALVNGGYYTQPSCVTSVDYLEQNTIYQNNQAGKQVYSPEAAYMMTDILKGVISTDYGTGHNLRIPGQIVAGKTGTTEESKDGWFCGYSAYYTTVVWSGYDTPAAVDNLFGSSYPGHIWLDYMTKIHEDLPELDFPKPPGIVFKNIDEQNNPTDIDTGRQDMFSERYLEKTAPEKQAVNQKTDKEKNAGADVPEPDKEGIAERAVLQAKKSQDDELKREQEADATIATLESLTAKSPQETIDSVYLEAKLRAAIVNDDDKQASYMSRIRAVQQALGLSDAH
jgi:penicillin-binding protein 1A